MEELQAAKDRVEELIESENIPEHLTEGTDIEDLQRLITMVYTEEIAKVDLEAGEEDAQEIIREFVERVALKVGLICLSLEPPAATCALQVSPEQLTVLFATLMRTGSANISIETN